MPEAKPPDEQLRTIRDEECRKAGVMGRPLMLFAGFFRNIVVASAKAACERDSGKLESSRAGIFCLQHVILS
jgi:hypothetical protein